MAQSKAKPNAPKKGKKPASAKKPATKAKPKGAGGRPTKRSKDRVKKLLEFLTATGTKRTACSAVSIDEETLSRWIANDDKNADVPKFERLGFLVAKAVDDCQTAHELNVRQAAKGTEKVPADWRASAWWLERKRPDEYRVKVDMVGGELVLQVEDSEMLELVYGKKKEAKSA